MAKEIIQKISAFSNPTPVSILYCCMAIKYTALVEYLKYCVEITDVLKFSLTKRLILMFTAF